MLEELIIRTLCDTLPEQPVDAMYLFAQTEDNQESVFTAALSLLQQKRISKVCFIKTPPISGYPGYKVWEESLVKLGIDKAKLETIDPQPADTNILHTRIEAESLIKHASQKKYKSIIVTAAPFQQTRAFMAAVTANISLNFDMKLYSYPGKPISWTEEVTHSQGKVLDTRAGLIAGELERIAKYHQKGDLLSVEQVLAYLNKRDISV